MECFTVGAHQPAWAANISGDFFGRGTCGWKDVAAGQCSAGLSTAKAHRHVRRGKVFPKDGWPPCPTLASAISFVWPACWKRSVVGASGGVRREAEERWMGRWGQRRADVCDNEQSSGEMTNGA